MLAMLLVLAMYWIQFTAFVVWFGSQEVRVRLAAGRFGRSCALDLSIYDALELNN